MRDIPRGQKIKGVNEVINLYRQKKRQEDQLKISNTNLPFMQVLYKQILSDRQSHSFYIEEFKNKQEVLNSINELWKVIFDKKDRRENVLQKIESLFTNMSEYEINNIYFKKDHLSQVSSTLFKDYSIISSALEDWAEKEFQTKKEREQWLKKDFYSFSEIHKALSYYSKENENITKPEDNNFNFETALFFYFKSAFQSKTHTINNKTESFKLISYIEKLYEEIKEVKSCSSQHNEFSTKETKAIKSFLTALMDLIHLIKPICLEKDKKKIEDLDKDTVFYEEFTSLYEKLIPIIKLYNKTRNYITQNKNRLEKIKINFEDSTLMKGWDVNKENDNLAIILRKKENDKWCYYLGIMSKSHRKIFDYQLNFEDYNKESVKQKKMNLKNKILATHNKEAYYEKMNYKLLPDPSKMLPKVFFSRKNDSIFNPSSEIKKIKQEKTYAKNDGNVFNLIKCRKFIDFYKASIEDHYDWKKFNFKFSDTSQYQDISDFYHEVSSQGYKLSFDKIKEDYIKEKVKKGELYLFKIYTKDFSTKSTGKPNLHTSYFKLLFDKDNLEDTIFKLNGQAEMFYRKASIQKKTTHKKNAPIQNKNPDNPKQKSTFNYDLIKDRRFTEDKYFFHVPIILNFKKKNMRAYQFNQEVLKFLKDNKNINIIGIDRGERHLAYYTVIDQQKHILDQGSFNNIISNYKGKNGQDVEVRTEYHKLLETREEERDKSRKSWAKIENIKELKSGYLSHLVHKISQMMIKYNAIVVFEDLNTGFKRGRIKFEKQVYQKLEKALIDKLNYLVFKDTAHKNPGGFLKAYQLTAPFESFQKMGKQTGFILYTPAYYTSKVDPLTGFINLIYPRYKNKKDSIDFFNSFEKISFDKEKDYFVFEYQDGKVNSRKKSESNTRWRVCTHGEDRYKYDRKSKSHKKIDVTRKLKALFNKYEIKYETGGCIKGPIVNQSDKAFFKELMDLLNLTIQLRHINPDSQSIDEKDFILSPVADEGSRFFDSRKAKEMEPKNADANGAYHIALKGLEAIKNIKYQNNKLQIPAIKNKDWFKSIKKQLLCT
ncbi:MAG: type V CRISPR-associated protein Cas12a/Cpf1 [Bdellovibrionales bacterium]|nr:type V CRISPR-associated protein Cas12a/Cpf1 [Bdellovibrionales bacterium]